MKITKSKTQNSVSKQAHKTQSEDRQSKDRRQTDRQTENLAVGGGGRERGQETRWSLFLMDRVRIKAKKSPKTGFKRWQILGTKLRTKHAYRESSSPAAASWSLFGRWVWGKTESVCVCVCLFCPWRRCKVVSESGIWEMGGEKETVNLDESYRLLLVHRGILGLGHCSTRQNLVRSFTPLFPPPPPSFSLQLFNRVSFLSFYQMPCNSFFPPLQAMVIYLFIFIFFGWFFYIIINYIISVILRIWWIFLITNSSKISWICTRKSIFNLLMFPKCKLTKTTKTFPPKKIASKSP